MFKNTELKIPEKQFDTYYKEKILPALYPMEQKRKKMLYILMGITPLIILWLIFAIGRITATDAQVGTIYGMGICFAILIIIFPMLNYYKKSKESLLPLIVGFFGDFTYEYQKRISPELLKRSKIISAYDSFETDDSFIGSYENTPISITEYRLYRKRTVRMKNGYQTINVKSGSGVIFSAVMNKKFNGETIVVKDKGWLNRFTHYKNLQRVGLESSEFEKKYEVYSSDQIEARYLLTTVMLEYMLEVGKIFSKVTYSFFDETIFINIETKENLFECTSFFRSIINPKRINQNFKELYYLFAIIKILRLNQKKLL